MLLFVMGICCLSTTISFKFLVGDADRMIIVPGYTTTTLIYEGNKTLVYQGIRDADQQAVIIKALRREYPSPVEIARFKHQYDIICSLNLDNVIKTYGIEKINNSFALILEDFGGTSLKEFCATSDLILPDLLEISIQITEALGSLHQHGIIHKDIKPQNIIINPNSRQIKVADFSVSSRLSSESFKVEEPEALEGTLAYMSPEQTGRINRTVDYRTDLYSLGITLYELFTGQLPFNSTDPIEVVHGHIARQPIPPASLAPNVPGIISDIILKLISKNAEDRYQSAFGLRADLLKCLEQWRDSREVLPFEIGSWDHSGRLNIPQKLYGRESEIADLLAAFERISNPLNQLVSSPGSELVLVTGYSGVGKSALIQEIRKPIIEKRGYFIAGKFDQFNRNIPYAPIIRAFQDLVRQLLIESDEKLNSWRDRLLKALGRNGQVIVDVIPEVELIIGVQPNVVALGPTESQNRFNLVFQQFITVFTHPNHPLVFFLDDLQWADSGSLQLIKLIMSNADTQGLLLIGAYRDQEVLVGHPLLGTLNSLVRSQVPKRIINLMPLPLEPVNQLLAETLSRPLEEILPLGQLIFAKTAGNPFFITQLLKLLNQESLVKFNFEHYRWEWDLDSISALEISENVVDLVLGEIQKLPLETQLMLEYGACVGNRFSLQLLAVVSEKPISTVTQYLWPALQVGLVIPMSQNYKLSYVLSQTELEQDLTLAPNVEYRFLHDRVQQAAYTLIPDDRKQSMHLQIGRLLIASIPEEQLEERIFDVVNQLNLGRTLITDSDEMLRLAELNQIAGHKAKASMAHEIACTYYQIGLDSLTEHPWDLYPELTLELHLGAVESAYAIASADQAEQLAQAVLQRSRHLLGKITVYELQIPFYISQNQPDRSITIALRALGLLGIFLPENPNPLQIISGLLTTKLMIGRKSIEDLAHLPDLDDVYRLAALRILVSVTPATMMVRPPLIPIATFTMVRLCVRYGNSPYAAYAYCMYGLVLCGPLGDITGGYRFGQLALRLLDAYGAQDLKAKVYSVFNLFIHHWKKPLRETIAPLAEAIQSGQSTGDLEYVGHATVSHCIYQLFAGENLDGLASTFDQFVALMQKYNQDFAQLYLRMYRQIVHYLIDDSRFEDLLSDQHFKAQAQLETYIANQNPAAIFFLSVARLMTAYLCGDYETAVADAQRAEAHSVPGFFHNVILRYYASLALLARLETVSAEDQKRYWKAINANQKLLKQWAHHAPENCQHKYALVEAEKARIQGRVIEAMQGYETAISAARVHDFWHEAAIANELAGQFYLSLGQEKIGQTYLREAHYLYVRWGAFTKVRQLETTYRRFVDDLIVNSPTLSQSLSISTTSGTNSTSAALDVMTVIKASQALAGEILLENLLTQLMQIAIENAGAQTGFLILDYDGQWVIQAEGGIDQAQVTILQALPLNSPEAEQRLSRTIAEYVLRTRESLLLDHASSKGSFVNDSYIRTKQTKSLLCTPLIHQGRLSGLIYLENNLTTGVFTQRRLELLNLLSSQAAISIENAVLYRRQRDLNRDLATLNQNLLSLNQAYERFVPRQLLQLLNKDSIVDVRLGDQVEREMSILFADIRSFTALSEQMTPEDNFRFINAFLSRMEPAITAHEGFIDKYIGDAIMALFDGEADNAVQAAITMLQSLNRYNDHRQRLGRAPIRLGVGINTGLLMLGTVGGENRMDGTVISDAVNVAARIEQLTKEYGISLMISHQTFLRLTDAQKYNIRLADRVTVRGRSSAVSVYEVFDADPPELLLGKRRLRTTFEYGLSKFAQGDYKTAIEVFNECLLGCPEDAIAQVYLTRCQRQLDAGSTLP